MSGRVALSDGRRQDFTLSVLQLFRNEGFVKVILHILNQLI